MGQISKVKKESIIKDIKAKRMGIAKIAAKHNVSENVVKNIKKELACPKCSTKKPVVKKVKIQNKNRRPTTIKVSRDFSVLEEKDILNRKLSNEEYREMIGSMRVLGYTFLAAIIAMIIAAVAIFMAFIKG